MRCAWYSGLGPSWREVVLIQCDLLREAGGAHDDDDDDDDDEEDADDWAVEATLLLLDAVYPCVQGVLLFLSGV